ncbi:MAG: LysR family transcriptional regulator [Myxococcaceae bacterium]|nr:LysR family transcriptional regulator [Myxococcaceae bacterium]
MALPTPADLRLLSGFASNTTLREAARRLGEDRSTLSRKVAALEERLGAAVFLRRGKQLVPTRFGTLLIEKASAVTQGLDEVSALVDAGSMKTLVIAASPLFAEQLLPAPLAALKTSMPELRVAIESSHDYRELFEERIDVAIRRGPLPDSDSLQSRRLGTTTMVVVASAKLARGLVDLEVTRLPFIRVGAGLEPVPIRLAGRRDVVAVAPVMAVDSQRAALELVTRGVGVARLNEFFVREALARGVLVELLPSARSTEGVHVVWARRRTPLPALRAFIRALFDHAPAEVFDP